MAITSILCGALLSPYGEPASCRIVGRSAASSVRLLVSRDPGLMGAWESVTQAPDVRDVFQFAPAVMAPGFQRYYYAIEEDSVVDEANIGTFVTFPEAGQKGDYRFIVASCLGNNPNDPRFQTNQTSNSPVLDLIAAEDALMTVWTGDWGYFDRATGTIDQYRGDFNENLLRPRQQALYLRRPLTYTWDDHDWLNSDPSDASFKDPVYGPLKNQVYRELMPHYPLPGSGAMGIYHSFQCGRDLHILTDLRSFRDNEADADVEAKTMMGSEQEGWFEDELIAAAADDSIDTVTWYSSSPWMGTGDIVDHWAKYPHNRDRMTAVIETFMTSGKAFVMVHGDTHALGLEDGSNNQWGGFPIYIFAAVDSSPNFRGDLPSHGVSQGTARYGEMEYEHHGRGRVIRGTGHIWDSRWRSLETMSPAGFLPSLAA